MSSQPVDRVHPVAEFAQRLTGRLDALAETPVWSMPPAEQRDTLITLARAEAQLASLKLRLLAQAETSGSTTESGAASAADWVAVETRQTRREARSELLLAQRLEDHDLVASALAHGGVNTAQARVIIAAVDRLPTCGEFAVDPAQRARAGAHLVALAADHDATALARLGRRVFEVIAPEMAERFEGHALEREEAEALRRTTFTMWEDHEGTCHGRFRIPTAQGQMLRKMILAISSPARSTSQNSTGNSCGIDPDLPTPVRHGIALSQLIESIPAKALPKAGGCGATVVVTMTLQQLLADLEQAGVCTLDTGGHISAAQARRLACQAGIIPVVLGGRSQVLDVGRKKRFHTEAMRIAMGHRDGGCTAVDCQTPPGLCHAHHDHPWSTGGPTNIQTGRLLCPHHHRRIHDPHYQATRQADGKISFHRRT